MYTIRLTCEAGTFEASGYVNVLDVPLKPRNLNPDEVRAEHVKLSWDPPLDDGGTPITGYLVRYMDIDSGEWATACTVNLETKIKIKLPHKLHFTLVTEHILQRDGQGSQAWTSLSV